MKLFHKRKQNALTLAQVAFIRKVYENRACAYCGKLRSAVSWWCGSEEAIAARHTAIPGVIHCPYWLPDKCYIRAELRDMVDNNKKSSNDKK